jgi:receptor protein-tyrosine kinase
MDLESFVRLLFRHAWLVAMITVVGVVAAWAVASVRDPVWEAETSAIVSPIAPTPSGSLYGVEVLDLNVVGTYVQLLRSRQVMQDAVALLPTEYDRDYLRRAIVDVRPVENSAVIVVSVRSTSRKLALELADAVVEAAMRVNPVPVLAQSYPMVVLDQADTDDAPAAPDMRLALLLGGLAGSMLGIGAAIVLDRRLAGGPAPSAARSAA